MATSATAGVRSAVWAVRGRTVALGSTPVLMGIVNVTPDSFSDGGLDADAAQAIERGIRLHAEGASILDIGGESTRPGARSVTADEEIDRVLPVIEGLASTIDAVLSIDTTKRAVAEAALEAGAHVINDVSALRFEPALADLAARTGAGLVLMHMLGEPRTMQREPRYDDLLGEIGDALEGAARRAERAGVDAASIVIDPGIGFGKTVSHNDRLLRRLDRLSALGYPVLVGHSRKSFLDPRARFAPRDRLAESLAAGILAAVGGAAVLRVHDVEAHARALAIFERWTAVEGMDGER